MPASESHRPGRSGFSSPDALPQSSPQKGPPCPVPQLGNGGGSGLQGSALCAPGTSEHAVRGVTQSRAPATHTAAADRQARANLSAPGSGRSCGPLPGPWPSEHESTTLWDNQAFSWLQAGLLGAGGGQGPKSGRGFPPTPKARGLLSRRTEGLRKGTDWADGCTDLLLPPAGHCPATFARPSHGSATAPSPTKPPFQRVT